MRNKSLFNWMNCLALGVLVALTGCNRDETTPKPRKASPIELLDQKPLFPALKVLNEAGEPLANAQVLIGMTQEQFPGNYGLTNEKGEFALPENWTQADTVTIDAAGYVRASYIGLKPESKVIILKKKFKAAVTLKGVTSGHPVRNKDGFIDYSLVMSAMTRQDLLNFQIQKVVSPVNDKIEVVGQEMNLPANVSLPRQTENYFIGITIDKPQYRLFFSEPGVQRVFAARGRFPFKDVVDGLRGDKEIFELINYFNITGGSIRDVNVVGNETGLNIPVMDLTFTEKKPFKAPKLSSSQVMVVLTVADNNGYLIPTDVKRLSSEQSMNLAVWNPNPVYLAQVIKNKNEFDTSKSGLDRLSAILLPFDERIASNYLPLISNPSAKGQNIFVIPSVSAELNKLTTFGLISDVKIEKDSKGNIRKTPSAVWEVYAPGWVTEIKLPTWKWQKSQPTTRFEVSLVGTTSSDTIPLGPQMMEKATHVTRSSVDY